MGEERLCLLLYRKRGQWGGMVYNVDFEMRRVATGLGEQDVPCVGKSSVLFVLLVQKRRRDSSV